MQSGGNRAPEAIGHSQNAPSDRFSASISNFPVLNELVQTFPSSLTSFNFWVWVLQLGTRVAGAELPVDPVCSRLRSSAQAAISDVTKALLSIRRSRHWRCNALNASSATFSQLPCFSVCTKWIRSFNRPDWPRPPGTRRRTSHRCECSSGRTPA